MTKNADMEAPEPRMVTVAVLDAARVFQGTAQIQEQEVDERHVVLPNGCDLAPGSHRHDPERGMFVPLDATAGAEGQQDPEAARAVALGFIACFDQGLTLPPETLAWLDWYTSSTDFQGPLDERTHAMVKRYRNTRKGG